MRRLSLLASLGAAALVAAGLAYATRGYWRPGPPLIFVERAEPGFRNLVASTAEPPPPLAPFPDTGGRTGDICAALFADPDAPRIGTGATVAVYFTDYRCPYCRVLGELLIERAEAGEITLIVKEWPILGPASRAAAEAALAAARQDAFLPAYRRLMGAPFLPTPAYLADLAAGLGIDPALALADARSPEVAAHLARNAALARALGFQGTPGLVVGRTVALRSVRDPMLDQLIREEDRLGPAPC